MDRFKLDPRQRARLAKQLHKTSDVRVYRRTLALLELDRGRSPSEVAATLDVTRQSIYNWRRVFLAMDDPAALHEGSGRGRPSVWTPELEAILMQSLQSSPDQLGYQAVDWTVALLIEHLLPWTGRPLSDSTVRRQLHRLDQVWKRPRYTLEPDPEREKKGPDSVSSPTATVAQCPVGRR
jgi:transposase